MKMWLIIPLLFLHISAFMFNGPCDISPSLELAGLDGKNAAQHSPTWALESALNQPEVYDQVVL